MSSEGFEAQRGLDTGSERISRCPVVHAAAPVAFFDQGFKRDPYPVYARLRAEEPVHRIANRDGRPMYLVTRHEDAVRALKERRFVKDGRAVVTPEQLGQLPVPPPAFRFLMTHMLAQDPPNHSRLRAFIRTALSPRMVLQLAPRIEQIANDLLDRVATEGRMDLIASYAFPLPITVIAELLGLPATDHEQLRSWSNVLITHSGTWSPASLALVLPVLEAMADYLRALFAHKRRSPGADLTTALLKPDEHGGHLSEDELVSMLLLLVLAGHETTVNVIGNGTLALLQHPKQLALLVRDPSLIPNAVEELLRFDGPVETSTVRYAAEDLVFAGVPIKRGALILVVLSSANRDERGRALADQLDIARPDPAHIAFGYGIHACIGAALARVEAKIAFEVLLRRAHNLKLEGDPNALQWRLGQLIRGLDSLPVTFTPVRAG